VRKGDTDRYPFEKVEVILQTRGRRFTYLEPVLHALDNISKYALITLQVSVNSAQRWLVGEGERLG